MAKTVEELMDAGLTKAEAERVINRQAKAAEKSESAKARAEKALPKAQADLDHAAARVEHWQGKAAAAQAKVDKYVAVISGESNEVPEDEESADEE